MTVWLRRHPLFATIINYIRGYTAIALMQQSYRGSGVEIPPHVLPQCPPPLVSVQATPVAHVPVPVHHEPARTPTNAHAATQPDAVAASAASPPVTSAAATVEGCSEAALAALMVLMAPPAAPPPPPAHPPIDRFSAMFAGAAMTSVTLPVVTSAVVNAVGEAEVLMSGPSQPLPVGVVAHQAAPHQAHHHHHHHSSIQSHNSLSVGGGRANVTFSTESSLYEPTVVSDDLTPFSSVTHDSERGYEAEAIARAGIRRQMSLLLLHRYGPRMSNVIAQVCCWLLAAGCSSCKISHVRLPVNPRVCCAGRGFDRVLPFVQVPACHANPLEAQCSTSSEDFPSCLHSCLCRSALVHGCPRLSL